MDFHGISHLGFFTKIYCLYTHTHTKAWRMSRRNVVYVFHIPDNTVFSTFDIVFGRKVHVRFRVNIGELIMARANRSTLRKKKPDTVSLSSPTVISYSPSSSVLPFQFQVSSRVPKI